MIRNLKSFVPSKHITQAFMIIRQPASKQNEDRPWSYRHVRFQYTHGSKHGLNARESGSAPVVYTMSNVGNLTYYFMKHGH